MRKSLSACEYVYLSVYVAITASSLIIFNENEGNTYAISNNFRKGYK